MSEIKFRAKGDDEETKDRWFYGGYAKLDKSTYCFKEDYDRHPDNTVCYIIFEEMTDWGLPNRHLRASVNPDTVGRYTGLLDENHKEIYEGDIIDFSYDAYIGNFDTFTAKGIIVFEDGAFYVKCLENETGIRDEQFLLYRINIDSIEIIGNIYDNPELLKERE